MLYDSKIWREDIDLVVRETPILDLLAGKSVLITGIGGLICSAIADVLIRYNELHNESITILAAGRSEERIRTRFGPYSEKEYFHYVPFDAVKSEFNLFDKANYIIHGASNATPDHIMNEPVETMMSNFSGTFALLNYAQRIGSSRFLYISSSEVYGQKVENRPYHEDEYGYIDLLNPRNSYSASKRAAETLCVSFATEYGVDSVIVRPGHVYGPTALDSDQRVSSAWAFEAAAGKDIVMKSEGAQIRSYVYCLDCAAAILTVLLKGKSLNAYNIANPNSVLSIKEMAELLAAVAGVELRTELPTQEEVKQFNPMHNSSLNGKHLLDLEWKACFDAKTGFFHTVQVIRGSGQGVRD